MKKTFYTIFVSLLLCIAIAKSQQVSQAEAKSIKINDTNFPDLYFQEYILATVDKNGDGTLNNSERNAVTILDVGGSSEYQLELEYLPVESLKGIEYFPNLKKLNCSESALTELDVSKNTKLVELRCNGNGLEKLNISNNRNLVRLYCQDNQLKSLSCKRNKKLTELFCGNNKIKKINVSKNKKLTQLSVSGNRLKKIDVSSLKNLKGLYASDNKLTALNVSKNKNLTELYVQNNRLKKLNLKKNRWLQTLYCENNQLVTGNLYLTLSTLETAVFSGQSTTIRVKKIKKGYLIPLSGVNRTNVLTNLSKGKITNKGIVIKGKKLPKKITYTYNMFTDGTKKTKVTIRLKK